MEKEFIKLIYQNQGILQKICNVYFFNNTFKEDYYQEILIRAWKAYPHFKGESAFSTWLYRVALNAAIDLIRKQYIMPQFVELSKNKFQISQSTKSDISGKREKLYLAIDKLSEMDKAIILLHLESYSYKEISSIMGISESNAGVKINRIKKSINKTIGI